MDSITSFFWIRRRMWVDSSAPLLCNARCRFSSMSCCRCNSDSTRPFCGVKACWLRSLNARSTLILRRCRLIITAPNNVSNNSNPPAAIFRRIFAFLSACNRSVSMFFFSVSNKVSCVLSGGCFPWYIIAARVFCSSQGRNNHCHIASVRRNAGPYPCRHFAIGTSI